MPRPRKPKREESEGESHRDTPFRHVLIDYMWNRRSPLEPPMSQGQLAIRLGMPRTTLTHWLNGTITPPLDVIFDVLARLGIPVQRLVEEYRGMGLPVPPLLEEDTGPTPRAYLPPAQPPARHATAQATAQANAGSEWDEMVERVAAEARDIGMDPDTIAVLVEHIRNRQQNRNPYDRYIRAEHSPEHAEQRQPSQAPQPSSESSAEPNGPESHTRRSSSSRSGSQPRSGRAPSHSHPRP